MEGQRRGSARLPREGQLMTNGRGNDRAGQRYDEDAVAAEVRAVREEYAEEEAEAAEIEAAENAAALDVAFSLRITKDSDASGVALARSSTCSTWLRPSRCSTVGGGSR